MSTSPEMRQQSPDAGTRRRKVLALVLLGAWGALAIVLLARPSVLPALVVAAIGATFFAAIWFRNRCAECGNTYFQAPWFSSCGLCPACDPDSPGRLGTFLRFGLFLTMGIGGIVALVAFYLSAILMQVGLPTPPAWTLGIVSGFAVAVLVYGLNTKTRRACGMLLRNFLLQSERLDFRAARKAAGHPGRVLREEGQTIWTDGTDAGVTAVRGGLAHARTCFEPMTGLHACPRRSLRVIAFETEAAMAAYTSAVTSVPPGRMEYRAAFYRSRVVLCRRLADYPPGRVEACMAHEGIHYLLGACLGRTPRPWLSEGLALLGASNLPGRLGAPGAMERTLLAQDKRGELLSAAQLLGLTYPVLHRRAATNTAAAWAFVEVVYNQSAGFMAFLAGCHGDSLKRFLLAAIGQRLPEEYFQASFGMRAEEAMARWRQTLRETLLPAHQEPPEVLKRRMEAEVLPVALDDRASTHLRTRAIRAIAAAGYPWWAAVLGQIAEGREETLRAEARRAVENIAGLIFPTPRALAAWLASVPVRPGAL